MLPEHNELLRIIAFLQLISGNAKQALALLQLLKETGPLDAGLLRLLAHAHAMLKPSPDSDVLLEKLSHSMHSEDKLLRARLLLAKGAKNKARDLFREYLAMKHSAGALETRVAELKVPSL
jgi:hypothetical protein